MSPTVYAWIRALEIESGDRLIQLAQKDAEIARLREAVSMLTEYCPAKDQHGKPEDCRVYGCKEGREALSASKGDENE